MAILATASSCTSLTERGIDCLPTQAELIAPIGSELRLPANPGVERKQINVEVRLISGKLLFYGLVGTATPVHSLRRVAANQWGPPDTLIALLDGLRHLNPESSLEDAGLVDGAVLTATMMRKELQWRPFGEGAIEVQFGSIRVDPHGMPGYAQGTVVMRRQSGVHTYRIRVGCEEFQGGIGFDTGCSNLVWHGQAYHVLAGACQDFSVRKFTAMKDSDILCMVYNSDVGVVSFTNSRETSAVETHNVFCTDRTAVLFVVLAPGDWVDVIDYEHKDNFDAVFGDSGAE